MNARLNADCRPLLIGSMPVDDHQTAMDLVMQATPEIPLWVQLPRFASEGMLVQFLPGMPGASDDPDHLVIDSASTSFEAELLQFFEDYIAVTEGGADWNASRFAMTGAVARGFDAFMARMAAPPAAPVAVKGQVTGPVTFCTGLHDQHQRAIFYDDNLREAAVKLLALKAAWQVRQMSRFKVPVLMFIDEPAMAGFGSSELISISPEDIGRCFDEVIGAIHDQGGLAGIHVCANTDWHLVLNSGVDVVNFDAYGYFDRFILYADDIRRFFDCGGILTWGLVPTGQADDIDAATIDDLWQSWQEKSARLVELGIEPAVLRAQSLISPSCGTGSLTVALAEKVLRLTAGLSDRIRNA